MAQFFGLISNNMQKQHYKILRDKDTGERFVRLFNGCVIPAAIAGMAAGPDKWLSEIQACCIMCSQTFSLRELGETGQWCETCASIDIQDN